MEGWRGGERSLILCVFDLPHDERLPSAKVIDGAKETPEATVNPVAITLALKWDFTQITIL